MTRYMKVRWVHPDRGDPYEPTLLFHEVGDNDRETRRVEVFADGRLGLADSIRPDDLTSLSLEPLPSLDEIDAQPEFEAEAIDQAEFELMWRRGRREPA